MNFINEFVRQLSILRGEAKSERICFITAPVDDLSDLAKTVMKGHGLVGDIQEPDRFHITLAVFPDFPEEAVMDFLQISLPIKFSVSAARLGTFESAPTNPLVLLVDPDPALVRLQSDIYNLGIKLGLQLSDPDHFKASKWQPHITLAMNVEELPDSFNMIKPVKVGVDRFVLQRDGYDEIVEVNLPGSIGDRLLVTVRSKVQRTVQPEIVEKITPETGIEVSHEDFMALMRGEQVIHGATRRVLTFDDGPFAVVRHGKHVDQEGTPEGGSKPGYTHVADTPQGRRAAGKKIPVGEQPSIGKLSELKIPASIEFDVTLESEARYEGFRDRILIGPKFFELRSDESRENVLLHEIGHTISDAMLKDGSAWELLDEGAFNGKFNGQIVEGISGNTTPGENLAEAYATFLIEPEWLKEHYPMAFEGITKAIERYNFPATKDESLGPLMSQLGEQIKIHGNSRIERGRPAIKKIKVEYKEKEFEFPEYFEGQEKVGHAAYGTQVFTPHLLGHVDTWEGSRQNAALQAYHRVVGAQKAKDENIHGFALSHGGNFVGVGALNFSPEDAPSEEDYMNIEALATSETGHSEAAMKEIIKKAAEESKGIFMNGGSEAKAFLSGIGMREDGKGAYFLTPDDVTSLSSELKGPKDGEYISPSSKPRLRQRFGRMFEESEVTDPIDNRPPPMSRDKQEWQDRDKWDRFNWDAWKDPEMVWNPENQMAVGFQEQNESLFQDEVDEEAERGKLDILGKIKEGGSSSMAFGRLGQSVSELFGGKPRESAKYMKDAKHYEKEYGEDIVWPEGRFEDDDESNERLLDFANQAEGVRDEDGEGNWHDSTEYIYNRTQQVLKEAGYETGDKVRLYRGIPTGHMPEDHDGGWVKLNLGSLSSWTFNRAIAGQAATRGGRGTMLRADIPVSRIYSMWATGPGSRESMEYLILGQDGVRAWATKISRK